jgi:hypothetical protein
MIPDAGPGVRVKHVDVKARERLAHAFVATCTPQNRSTDSGRRSTGTDMHMYRRALIASGTYRCCCSALPDREFLLVYNCCRIPQNSNPKVRDTVAVQANARPAAAADAGVAIGPNGRVHACTCTCRINNNIILKISIF